MERLYKLRKWVPEENLCWNMMSKNPFAIYLLKQNLNKIEWNQLSKNPSAMQLLEQNSDKIDWSWLSQNSAAIHLEANPDKICWDGLSANRPYSFTPLCAPRAMH